MAVDRQNQSYNELQHISARFNQFILDNTRDLIAIHNLSDLSYEYVNPDTLKALGYEKELPWQEPSMISARLKYPLR